MKHLLKIKFSAGRKFPVRVRAARLPEKPGGPVGTAVLVIMPDGTVMHRPNSSRFPSNNSPRRGSLESAALAPWQLRPARCVRASAVPRHLTLSLEQMADGGKIEAGTLPAPHSMAASGE